ncbi:hypothetical protein LUZ60_014590 [Juncus effusus]|nr:hypothetical protein LUZ60_014590 [Juncus effusus]
MISLVGSLEIFGSQLSNKVLCNEQLKGLFEKATKPRSPVEKSLLETRDECLKLLRGLVSSLVLPCAMDVGWVRNFCLGNAVLIFSTASSSFMLHNSDVGPLDVLVIDEAAQLKECESVIPLRLGGIKHAILVGDEMQLPSMIKSMVCKKAGFGVSLFERLVMLGHEKHLLGTQYRMHPSISWFPNSQFYADKLLDGSNVMDGQYNENFSDLIFGSYAFINVADGREEADCIGNSRRNLVEVAVVLQLIQGLFESWKRKSDKDKRLTVGVISPYAAQIKVIQEKVGIRYDAHDGFDVRVKSVDGFQGEEDDIIILSTVRCNAKAAVGFMENIQRTNVAITRAKHCLWIVGSASTLLKSGTVWEDLVIDAQNRNCLFNANNYDELKKVILRVKTELDQLDDLLHSDSMLFGTARWKVLFSDEFRKSFTKLRSTQMKRDTINLLLQIATGWRSKRKNLTNVPDIFDLARIYKIGDLYLVWSTDLEKQEQFMQIVRVWDLLPLTQVERFVRRMNNIFCLYSDAYIERCRVVRLERAIEVPMTWHDGYDIVKFRKDHQNHSYNQPDDPAASNSLENSKVSESLLLMKFYALSSGVAKHLLTAQDGSELDVPFELNDQEKEIIRFPLSSFILGRSGTGKTTVLTTKLVQKEQQYFVASHGVQTNRDVGTCSNVACRDDVKNGEMGSSEDDFIKQVFITVSPKLCSAIKSHISRFRRFTSGDDSSSQVADMHDIIGKLDDFTCIPDTFVDLEEKHFPLIITFRKFLMMVDGSGTMESSFFNRFYTNWGVSSQAGVKKSHALQAIIESKEVEYEKFAYSYWPHFNTQLTKKLDPSTVFTQIISHIKGGSNLNEGKLGREEYVLLSDKRFSSLDAETRGKIYDIFLDYETKKRAEGEFDISDFVNFLHNRLNQDGFKGGKVDFIYIDEVQDLTTRQIALLKHVCMNFNEGFVFAGDTAQTIARGVDFRFEDIRALFYTEFLLSTANKENNLRVADMFQLFQNFRTHCGVLKLAQSVMNILYFYFPYSVDKLTPETSLIYGEAPILLESGENENAIGAIFGEKGEKRQGKLYEFGAEQAILVRDDQAKKQVLELVGKQAIVLTILECKGLEFQDVLLYDFFASSPLESNWRVVYGFMENQEIYDSSMTKGYPIFDPTRHHLLCSELKQLTCLVQVQNLDPSIVQAMGNSSSAEDWKRRGIKLFNDGHYEMATMCFEKAGDQYREKWARAAGLVATADRVIGTNSDMGRPMLYKALDMYESIGKHEIAASCYIKLRDFEKAGTIYLEKCGTSRLEEAGDCFVMAQKWSLAADEYFKAKCISKCISTCSKGELFEKGLRFLNKWKEDETQTEVKDLELIRQTYLESCAVSFHERKDTNRMLLFVRAFGSMDTIRLFLESRDLFDELLALEIEAGNFLEAMTIAQIKGDVLLEAEMCEKACLFESASRLVLVYIKKESLWFCGNKGWPIKPFDEKAKLLTKAKRLGKKVSDSFSNSIDLEADLFADKPKSLMELSKALIEANKLENIWAEYLATRSILDIHLSPHAQYIFESEWCLSFETHSGELTIWNVLTPRTLVHVWNHFKGLSARILSFQNNEMSNTKEESTRYEVFCAEYFGLRKYDNDDVYVVLNPKASWVRGKVTLQTEKNRYLIKTRHFISCVKSYFSTELYSIGVKVAEKLEGIMRSPQKPGSATLGCYISIAMYEVAKFLRELEIGQNDGKLKPFFNLSQCWFWDAIFPLDWRNGVSELVVRSLNHTIAAELLEEILDTTIGSKCVSLSYRQLGKVAMILLLTGKLTDDRYSKITSYLFDKPKWIKFFDMLKAKFDHGCETMSVVLIFEEVLKSTFDMDWRCVPDYISPHCYFYLLDRFIFLVSSCSSVGYMITTKSSVAEMIKLRGFQSYFDSPLQVREKSVNMNSLGFNFSVRSIRILQNKEEMREWIRKCGLPDNYYRLMVLKLVIMFYTINLYAGFDLMYTGGKLLLDSRIFADLPSEFSKKLRLSMYSKDVNVVLGIIADAFMLIGDPLVVIGSGEECPFPINSNACYMHSDLMKNEDAVMALLFPKGSTSSPANNAGEIGKNTPLTSPVIEKTGENNFWSKFEAFRQKNISQRDLKEIIDFLESILSWLNENGTPEGFDGPYIKEIKNACAKFRNLSRRDNGKDCNNSAIEDLNAIWNDGEGKLEVIVEQLANYKVSISEKASEVEPTQNETTEETTARDDKAEAGSSTALRKSNKGQQNKKSKNKHKGRKK